MPPIVPRLRICGEPTVRDASASAGQQPGERGCHRLGVRQSRAEAERAVLARPAAKLLELGEVDEPAGRDWPNVSSTSTSVPPWMNRASGCSAFRRERLVESARRPDVHGGKTTTVVATSRPT